MSDLWTEIVNQEADYLARVSEELDALGKLTEQSPALEQIYAAAHHAYALAYAEQQRLEADIASMSSVSSTLNAGWIPPALRQSLAALPQNRRAVVQEMLTTFRFCLTRPSDIMRQEMRRQAGAILNGLQQLVSQSNLSDEALARDVQVIGNLLCRFDTLTSPPAEQPAAPPWYASFLTIPGLLTVAGVGALAWLGRGFAEEQGWFGLGEPARAEEGEGEDATLDQSAEPLALAEGAA